MTEIITQKILSGWCRVGDYGENFDAVKLGQEPIALWFEENDLFNKPICVSYYVCEKEKTREEAKDNFINRILGVPTGEYTDNYSEITGYLWTDQSLEIGGHNLLDELRANEGKYIILIVDEGTLAALKAVGKDLA